MQFFIIASILLMPMSIASNLCLQGIRGRVGRISQIENMKGKFRAYTKTVSPLAMGLAAIFLFATTPFNLITLILVLIAIFAYALSSIIAWKQYLLQDEESKITKQRMIASFVGNVLTAIIWITILPVLVTQI